MDTQDFEGILETGDNDQATRSLQSHNSFIQGGPHGSGRGQKTGFLPNSLLDQGLNLPLQCVLGGVEKLLREAEVGRWGSGPQTFLLPQPGHPPTYSMAVQLVAQALSEFVQTLLGKKMQKESTRQGQSGPPTPRPLTWDWQTPDRPSPHLPQGLFHIPDPTTAWSGPSTYRHHGLWWSQVGKITNAHDEGPAGGKVVPPTFQEAIPQFEELGNNRATGSRAGAAPLLSDLSPPSQGCALPSPTYTSLRPSLLSNTHSCILILVSFLPLLWAWIKIPLSLTAEPVGFTSWTSLLPCDICLDP